MAFGPVPKLRLTVSLNNDPADCPTCEGKGYTYVTCKLCHGTGWRGGRYGGQICCGGVDEKECPDCHGSGKEKTT